MNISTELKQIKELEKELKITQRVSELTKQRKLKNHRRASKLENIRDAKSCGLTMEDIT